jgi:hypothetical protein
MQLDLTVMPSISHASALVIETFMVLMVDDYVGSMMNRCGHTAGVVMSKIQKQPVPEKLKIV